jgi:ABC-type lipoprotein release transport system permease subunit
MILFIKLAWRNILRNKRRTIIAGTAIGLGLASMIFIDALMIGFNRNLIQSVTSSFLGDGQIHREGYRESQEVELTIKNIDTIVSNLEKEEIVKNFTLRVMAFGMITSPADVNSVNVVGINPETEKTISQIDDAIEEGNFFEENNERDIIIGRKLAEILEVELGDRVVLTVAQAETGDLAQEMFRISGIYFFNIPEMDRAMAFIQLPRAQKMLNIGENVHEIALKFKDTNVGMNRDHQFFEKYSTGNNEAVGWVEIMPQLESAIKLSDISIYITALILFGVIALGIVNTLFMSLHDRMFEFGVLRAIGTRPLNIMRLIIFEAGSLSVVSIVLGNIIGFLITFLFTQIGIDYTGIEYVGVTFRELIYPVLTIEQFIKYPFWTFIFTIIVGIYPALHAARMKPAEAMRKSL